MHSINKLISSSRIALATGAVALLSAPMAVFAADDNTSADITKNLEATGGKAFGQGAIGGENSLPVIIGNIIRAALGLLGVVMVILIIYAGFLYLTAAGDDTKVEDAKKIIKNAIIGAVLIFTAYAITNFVVTNIVSSTAGQ
jgi:hypothetical protein